MLIAVSGTLAVLGPFQASASGGPPETAETVDSERRSQAGGSGVRERMQVAHHGARTLVEHVRVDLRGRDVRVPEQFLNHAQVGPILQQVARESVAQDVRADEIGPDSRS